MSRQLQLLVCMSCASCVRTLLVNVSSVSHAHCPCLVHIKVQIISNDSMFCTASSLLQGLLQKPQALYAMVLSPTRELAIQIAEQFEALGSGVGVKCAVLVGGIDMMAQAIALGRRPHVIVGTPGRVVDHLSNTKVCCCCFARLLHANVQQQSSSKLGWVTDANLVAAHRR